MSKLHEMNAEQLAAYLRETEDTLRKLENLKTVASTKVAMLRERLKEIYSELRARGIEPDKIDEELEKINQLILEKQTELDKLLPPDVIEKYKAITPEELSDARALESMNLDQAF